jgi:hypothetical protein
LYLSTRVLLDLKIWLEETAPNALYTRKAKQVMDLKTARAETLGAVIRQLKKREEKGVISEEEGYTGAWETVGADGEMEGARMQEEDDHKDEENVLGDEEEKGKRVSRNSAGQLEQAAEVGRRASEEAEERTEYEFLE